MFSAAVHLRRRSSNNVEDQAFRDTHAKENSNTRKIKFIEMKFITVYSIQEIVTVTLSKQSRNGY